MQNKNLAKNIRILRKKRKWTQDELAQESGVTYTTIIKLEQGIVDNPTLRTLEKLSEVFKTDIDSLIKQNKDK